MFKLCLALAFGLVAAFAVGLAGLLADVGLAAILLRCFLGFLLAGLVSYAVALVLEAKEWANFDKESALASPAAAGEEESLPAEEGQAQEEGAEAPAEGTAEEQGFTPFAPESLDHVEPR